MIRQKTMIWPVVLLTLGFGLAGCAGRSARPGEPSPKQDTSALAADESAAPAPVDESTAPQTEALKPSTTAPPMAAPLVLSAKPRIVAKVEVVQFPAWVERGGVKAAIKAGWAIYTSDRITTGPEGRVELGVVGEGKMNIAGGTDISATPAYEATEGPEPPIFALNRGAFAFTAPMARAGMPGLPLQIGEGITATVLGGSLFAKADGEEDLMALVNGLVQVNGPKLNPGSMKTDDTFLRVPRAGRAQPVSTAGSERVARWLSSTQLVQGRPLLDAAGTWDVSLNSGYNLKILETMACRIQNRGYPSEIYPVREPGKQVWYRVVVRRFKSRTDAVDFLGTAKALGAREPWVLIPQT